MLQCSTLECNNHCMLDIRVSLGSPHLPCMQKFLKSLKDSSHKKVEQQSMLGKRTCKCENNSSDSHPDIPMPAGMPPRFRAAMADSCCVHEQLGPRARRHRGLNHFPLSTQTATLVTRITCIKIIDTQRTCWLRNRSLKGSAHSQLQY